MDNEKKESRLELYRRGELYHADCMDIQPEDVVCSVPVSGSVVYFNPVGKPFKVLSYMSVRNSDKDAYESMVCFPVCQELGAASHGAEVCELTADRFTVPMYFVDVMEEEDLKDLYNLYKECFKGDGNPVSYARYKARVQCAGVNVI